MPEPDALPGHAQVAAASANSLALHSSATPTRGGRHPARYRPGLTRPPLQQRTSVFLVPTGIVWSIRPGSFSQSAVYAISDSQGALAPAEIGCPVRLRTGKLAEPSAHR